jgi:hypothetical protein
MVSTGLRTGPGVCPRPVAVYVLVRYLRSRQVWRVFLCAGHGAEVPAAEPLDDIAEQELADRRAQHDRALAGCPYRRPRPLQPQARDGGERSGPQGGGDVRGP